MRHYPRIVESSHRLRTPWRTLGGEPASRRHLAMKWLKRCRSRYGNFWLHNKYVDNRTGKKFCIRCDWRAR